MVATAVPFDPASSRRRFTIGAPDGVLAVVLPPLLVAVRREAPLVDIANRQLLPPQGGVPFERASQHGLDDLETRAIDIAIRAPACEVTQSKRFCEMRHVLVSLTGDAHGFVDDALAERGLKRRIELTVPNFMMAMAIVAESDLIAALPRQLVASHGAFWRYKIEIANTAKAG